MSAVWWADLLASLFALVAGYNFWLITRELRRSRERFAALTHRVWKLEGCPRHNCEGDR